MIRVAHVITNLTTGGAEMLLYRMLQVTYRSRFEAEVCSLKQELPWATSGFFSRQQVDLVSSPIHDSQLQ